MESTLASSSAWAIWRAWATLYWWRMAWLPSRSVTSEMWIFLLVMVESVSVARCGARRHALRGGECGAGHDVQVARIGRQVVRGGFHFEEDRRLQAAEAVADARDAQ